MHVQLSLAGTPVPSRVAARSHTTPHTHTHTQTHTHRQEIAGADPGRRGRRSGDAVASASRAFRDCHVRNRPGRVCAHARMCACACVCVCACVRVYACMRACACLGVPVLSVAAQPGVFCSCLVSFVLQPFVSGVRFCFGVCLVWWCVCAYVQILYPRARP